MSRLKSVLIFIGHLFVSTWGVGISSAMVTFYSFAILRPLKLKEKDGWGSKGADARTLARFRRLLGRTKPADLKLLIFMAGKMAQTTLKQSL
jgi:hypothetical protein